STCQRVSTSASRLADHGGPIPPRSASLAAGVIGPVSTKSSEQLVQPDMVEVKVLEGGAVKSTQVDASAFGTRVLGRTLKDAVVMYEANVRAGTVQAKTRTMVRGGNKKLWKQKHTG